MDKLQISNMLSFVAKKYENIISTFEDKWKKAYISSSACVHSKEIRQKKYSQN